jgi:transposase-like protein
MSRKPRVQRTPEEKWQIVLEGWKSGNVAETCRKYEIAPNLYYRWKDEVEAGVKAALGGGAQPRSPMPSRRNGSSNWSGRWVDPICRLRY